MFFNFPDESTETIPTIRSVATITNGSNTSELPASKEERKAKVNEVTEVVEIHPPPPNLCDDTNSERSTPPPPPPPPPPLQSQTSVSSTCSSRTGTYRSTKSIGGISNQQQMQQELKYVLTIYREKKKSEQDALNRDAILDQYTTPSAVQNWLIAKGFSEKACKQLRDMTGSDIFDLTKRQLEHYCGVTEGSKLYSQITLAKTETEKKSPRTSELKQVLEKARHRAEEQ